MGNGCENVYYDIYMTQLFQTLGQLSAAIISGSLALPVYSYYFRSNTRNLTEKTTQKNEFEFDNEFSNDFQVNNNYDSESDSGSDLNSNDIGNLADIDDIDNIGVNNIHFD